MTVALIASIQRWVGLSTDTKPTAPPAGSTFYETDTGQVFVYDGSAWQLGPEGSPWRLARGNWNFTDDGGAQGTFKVFDHEGDVMLQIVAVAKVGLTSGGAATVELGVAGDTAIFLPLTTATDLVIGRLWHDASPTTTVEAIDFETSHTFVLPSGPRDINLKITTANLTAGEIDFYCLWRPLSVGGLVVAA